jgi:hypothetical protein
LERGGGSEADAQLVTALGDNVDIDERHGMFQEKDDQLAGDMAVVASGRVLDFSFQQSGRGFDPPGVDAEAKLAALVGHQARADFWVACRTASLA